MPASRQSVILGAVVIALLSTVFAFAAQSGNQILGIFACCLPPIVGSLVAVWHYTNTHNVSVELGSGATMGALTGVVGGLIGAVLNLLLTVAGILPSREERIEMARDQMLARDMPADQLEQSMQFVEFANSVLGQLVFTAVFIIVFALVGALGGLIGAKAFGGGKDTADASPKI